MTKLTTTSALALGLVLAACAQDGADTAAYDQEYEESAAAAPADEASEAAPEDSYAALQDEEPLAEPLPEPGLDTDPMLEDPIAEELSSDDYAAAEPLPVALAEDQAIAEVRDEFAMADTDGDGALSRDEFLATMAPLPEPGSQPIGEGDAVFEDDAMATAGQVADLDPTAAEYLTAKFQTIAGDDEAATLAEIETATREDFAAADEDGDAVLTGEETEAFAALRSGQPAY